MEIDPSHLATDGFLDLAGGSPAQVSRSVRPHSRGISITIECARSAAAALVAGTDTGIVTWGESTCRNHASESAAAGTEES
jgi:hypothetical protein